MFKPVEQKDDIRERHPADKNDNIYLEFEKFMSIDTIPLPVGFDSHTRVVPIINECRDYEVTVANFVLSGTNLISNPAQVKRIVFLTNRCPVAEELKNSQNDKQQRILFSYYPSQAELTTSTSIAFNNQQSIGWRDLDFTGSLREVDLQVQVERYSGTREFISAPYLSGASVVLNFRRKMI
jgi:hypothetical protein